MNPVKWSDPKTRPDIRLLEGRIFADKAYPKPQANIQRISGRVLGPEYPRIAKKKEKKKQVCNSIHEGILYPVGYINMT